MFWEQQYLISHFFKIASLFRTIKTKINNHVPCEFLYLAVNNRSSQHRLSIHVLTTANKKKNNNATKRRNLKPV